MNKCTDEEVFYNQGRSGGHRCKECHKWIKVPRKRKHFIPTILLECDDCQFKGDFARAYDKLNAVINDSERKALNKFRWQLHVLCARLTESYQTPSNWEFFIPDDGNLIKNEIFKIPLLLDENKSNK